MCKTWCHSIVDISKFDGMKHEKTPSKQCREGHDYNPLVRDIFYVPPDDWCVQTLLKKLQNKTISGEIITTTSNPICNLKFSFDLSLENDILY